MDGCVAHTSLVRYDAMNEFSGQQSSTLALLDSRSTGVVISSILHRDQARFYVKQVREGTPEYELSPRSSRPSRPRSRDRHAGLMRVAYLGPAGTYSEEALRASRQARSRRFPTPPFVTP